MLEKIPHCDAVIDRNEVACVRKAGFSTIQIVLKNQQVVEVSTEWSRELTEVLEWFAKEETL